MPKFPHQNFVIYQSFISVILLCKSVNLHFYNKIVKTQSTESIDWIFTILLYKWSEVTTFLRIIGTLQ